MNTTIRWTLRGVLTAASVLGFAVAGHATDSPPAACSDADCSNDSQIESQVREVLNKSPELGGENVTASVRHGVVYLNGVLDTNVQKENAETAMRRIAGVKRVVNSISVKGR